MKSLFLIFLFLFLIVMIFSIAFVDTSEKGVLVVFIIAAFCVLIEIVDRIRKPPY